MTMTEWLKSTLGADLPSSSGGTSSGSSTLPGSGDVDHLSQLPAELVSAIAQAIDDPDSVLSFSRVSRRNRRILDQESRSIRLTERVANDEPQSESPSISEVQATLQTLLQRTDHLLAYITDTRVGSSDASASTGEPGRIRSARLRVAPLTAVAEVFANVTAGLGPDHLSQERLSLFERLQVCINNETEDGELSARRLAARATAIRGLPNGFRMAEHTAALAATRALPAEHRDIPLEMLAYGVTSLDDQMVAAHAAVLDTILDLPHGQVGHRSMPLAMLCSATTYIDDLVGQRRAQDRIRSATLALLPAHRVDPLEELVRAAGFLGVEGGASELIGLLSDDVLSLPAQNRPALLEALAGELSVFAPDERGLAFRRIVDSLRDIPAAEQVLPLVALAGRMIVLDPTARLHAFGRLVAHLCRCPPGVGVELLAALEEEGNHEAHEAVLAAIG